MNTFSRRHCGQCGPLGHQSRLSFDPPEPNFPPVQEIGPVTSAECKTGTVTKHIFQHDCIPEMFHLTCSFSDEIVSAISYAVSSAAERTLIRTEVQPPVVSVSVQCRNNLLKGLYLHHISRLQPEKLSGRLLLCPAHVLTDELCMSLPPHPHENALHHSPSAYVAGRNRAETLFE